MPAIVRARLSAGLAAHDDLALDDGRLHRAPRTPAAPAILITEWPHADAGVRENVPTIHLLDPGVTPGGTQLARGSTAWLPLDAEADDVVAAAHAVARGLTVIAPLVLPTARNERVRNERVRRERAAVPVPDAGSEPHLTERELDVLRALAEGLGNKQIGARLGISASTVKYHLQAIFAKLDVSTRSEAVSFGLRHGVVPL